MKLKWNQNEKEKNTKNSLLKMKSEWNENNTKMTYCIKNQKDQIEMAWKWNQYKMEKSEKNNSN